MKKHHRKKLQNTAINCKISLSISYTSKILFPFLRVALYLTDPRVRKTTKSKSVKVAESSCVSETPKKKGQNT